MMKEQDEGDDADFKKWLATCPKREDLPPLPSGWIYILHIRLLLMPSYILLMAGKVGTFKFATGISQDIEGAFWELMSNIEWGERGSEGAI